MVNNKTLAIILGGGQGTRLYPLTESQVKTGGAYCG